MIILAMICSAYLWFKINIKVKILDIPYFQLYCLLHRTQVELDFIAIIRGNTEILKYYYGAEYKTKKARKQ